MLGRQRHTSPPPVHHRQCGGTCARGFLPSLKRINQTLINSLRRAKVPEKENLLIVGEWWPPTPIKICPYLKPRTCEWGLFGRDLCKYHSVKDLETRASGLSGWILDPMTSVRTRERQ